jgi:hypothetical protein
MISSRSNGSGCPACAGRVVTENNCLATTHPELSKGWHPTKNGNLTPRDVTPGSSEEGWWVCNNSECGYEWPAFIYSRTSGNGCPACAGKVVTENNCLATTYPELSKGWHPTKNGNLTPHDVTHGSNKEAWWICNNSECKYEWPAMINNRTSGNGCPACAGKVATENNCLATTHPELSKGWHPTKNGNLTPPTKNGNLTPHDVTPGSDKKVWWECNNSECKYEWPAMISNRTSGSDCPNCAGKVATENNCLATTHPELSKGWHPTII